MFQPGDVLLFRRKTLISRAIRLIQGNAFIHSAVVISGGDEYSAVVAEIDSDFPARIVNFSVAAKNGTVEVFRHKTLQFSDSALTYMAFKVRGTKYNYLAILQSTVNHFFGRLLGFCKIPYSYFNLFPGTNKLICSTLTSFMLASVNKQYQYDPLAEPDDFCKGDWEAVKTGV